MTPVRIRAWLAALLAPAALLLLTAVPAAAADDTEDDSLTSPTITVPADVDISDWLTPAQVTSLSPEQVQAREEQERIATLVELGLWRWYAPVAGAQLTSPFGYRPAIEEAGVAAGLHPGVDLAAALGLPIVSTFAGTVDYVGEGYSEWGVSGWVIVVDHGVIDGHRVRTGYNHMAAEGVLVQVGQVLDPGELIGLVGSQGRSTGPHLHLTLEIDGQVVDPEPWFAEHGVLL